MKLGSIKPQDIVVLAKLMVQKGPPLRLMDMAVQLGLSQSEVSHALERALRSGLVRPDKRTLNKSAFLEFLVHGLKYIFPGQLGSVVRGVPTSHSAAPLSGLIVASDNQLEQYVWPHAEGTLRGISVEPLYPSVPVAAQKDERLHEVLALIDAIRIGRAREQKLAAQELNDRLQHAPV